MRNARMLGTALAFSSALVVAAFSGAPARADDHLRCGMRLVSVGDPTTKVRAVCGEPLATSIRRVLRRVSTVAHVPCAQGSPALCRRAVRDLVEIEVEEWTYDFGPQRLVHFVTFEQGKLHSVRNGGFGELAEETAPAAAR